MNIKMLYGRGNNVLCYLCPSSTFLSRGMPILNMNKRTLTLKDNIKDEDLMLFYKSEVQSILRRLTGFNISKIFSKRKLGDKLEPPTYKFMTSQEVQDVMAKVRLQAEELLQMPPVVPVRKEVEVILSKDPEIIGLTESNYVFTDISFGKTDRTRMIVVREPNGNLRKAYSSERRNANQTYFPLPGRQYRIPKMFQPEFLKGVLERGDYIFLLDRACVEFDADDPEYHRVTQATYDAVQEKQAFGALRFTRHFGPMVFYFVLNKTIDDLLLENLKTNRLEDAVGLVTLYNLVHGTTKSAESYNQFEEKLNLIKEYIEKESKQKVALELALMALKDDNQIPEEVKVMSN